MYKEDYIWNPSTCTCKNNKHLESDIDDSVITCDEIIDVIRSEPRKLWYYKNVTCTMDNFYILFAFILIVICYW